jgi:tetratricopeptide (TPR) repeat protein
LQAPLDTAAKELRNRAVYAYQNGWYAEALADFIEAESKNYQDFAVHRSIANIYLYHEVDLPKALEYFGKAAKYARPKDNRQAAEAEYFAGIVCGILHKVGDAIEHMEAAIQLNPNLYDASHLSKLGFNS